MPVRSTDLALPHSTTPRASWLQFALLFLVGAMFTACTQQQAATPAPAPEVEVAAVEERDVPIYGEWVATLDGYVNAQIQPQVTGYLWRQTYREGDVVSKGSVLFEIDPRPFFALLQQARGQLAQAEAQLSKATLDVERDTPLAKQSAIPQAQLDNDLQAKAAAVAVVAAAKAQVDQAQLNVNFTQVRSLVNGIAGLAKGQIGDLVGPTTVLTTVSQVQPIKAYFAISEQEYLKAAAMISAYYQGKHIEQASKLDLLLADGSKYPHLGWIISADRQVDAKTGTIRLAAAFDNPGGILRPGQFARVRIQTRVAKNTLVVPQRSVMETQGAYQVIAVSSDNKASIRPVKVGEKVADSWIITEGLKPGERVIVEGLQKVKEGTAVTVKAATARSSSGM